VRIHNCGSLNDIHVPANVYEKHTLILTDANAGILAMSCLTRSVPNPDLCPSCTAPNQTILFVAMTTVRIQFVGSSYASRLQGRRGKEINGIGGRRSRKKESEWRMEQHADVRNEENKLANVLRLFTVRVTANCTCHIAKGRHFETKTA
jgi:hypothetical protein